MSSVSAKLKTFRNLSPQVKKLLIQAIFISAFVKFTLVFLPFKKVLGWLGKPGVETNANAQSSSLQLRKNIKTAIGLCDKYSFWKTECYTQALTGKILLKQLNLPGTVYIGFNLQKENYKGHAWLRSYDLTITGEKDQEIYSFQYLFS